MRSCDVCQSPRVTVLLDVGHQPICNRFMMNPTAAEYTHPMVLGQCEACGLVQLASPPVPAAELKPRFPWLTYKEAEEHLDSMAQLISALPGLTPESVIAGVSDKDDSLLARLNARGIAQTWRIDPEGELQVAPGGGIGVETIQARLNPAKAAEIVRRRGGADVVIARHILEHAHDVRGFVRALASLLKPGGYLVLEVPDCTRALDTCDYTTLWEEHTLYFTPQTFRPACERLGLFVRHFEVFPCGVMEYPIVAITQLQGARAAPPTLRLRPWLSAVGPRSPRAEHGTRCEAGSSRVLRLRSGLGTERSRMCRVSHASRGTTSDGLSQELARARAFAERFYVQRQRLQRWFADFQRTQGKIAVFGAGHLSCAFINLHELQPYLACVIDDHPKKQGLYMPGSHLPIRNSEALLAERIRLCLLGLSPEAEDKIIERNGAFMRGGGRFASILMTSKRALQVG